MSCTNPGEMLTNGAVTALASNADTLRALTRTLTREATTTATAAFSEQAHELTAHLADTLAMRLDTQRNRFLTQIDDATNHFFATSEKTAHRIESDLLSDGNLRYAGKLRDSLTGEPVQSNIRALVRVAFQEFRKQQDSTLKALENRSDSWQTRLQNLAAPVLSVVGGLVLLALIILAIIRFILFLQHNRKKHHGNN
jgi:hypothetical protein